MTERRVIAHIDADAFYASVHLLEDPSLAGKPVIVAGNGLRSIVTTASYEARKFGIGSAMPATQARRLCPHGIFIRPNFTLYRAYSSRAMEVIERYVSEIEPLSLDEAYLDITDLDNPVRAVREMVAEIHRETGLHYSVGIGPNKLCAKVLSDFRKPRAFNVASREQCCELFAGAAPRTIPGIGPKTAAALEALGLTTIAAVRDDKAQVIVLGCTGMAGCAETVADMLEREFGVYIPVIDPVAAAIASAIGILRIQLSHSKLAYATPACKPIVGFDIGRRNLATECA